MSKKDNYELIHFLDIRFADPISSLKLINNYVITGTMMGRVNLYNISNNKTASLSELNSENISDISYNEKEKIFYVGIGDEEIRYFFIDQLNLDPIPQKQPINVYDSDITHTNNCENAFILLSPESLFRIQLPQIDDGTLKIITIESQYEIKYFNEEKELNKNEIMKHIKQTLPTTNYIVPFDFDGKRFLWVEFLSSTQRNLCVSSIPLLESEKPFKIDLNKNIGHICQAKLLPNNRVFFVHSLNKCEIRDLDIKFTLLEQFEHIGEEVLAVDICFNEENEKITNSNGMDNFIIHKNKMLSNNEIHNKVDEVKLKNRNHKEDEINTNRVLETSDNVNKIRIENEENGNNEYLYIKQNIKKEKIIDIKDICVVTLDIDGNVNLFKNKKEKTLFNLYELNTISKDHKDKLFFSMGYAYYIKSNLNYFCISSDHGCYIIKDNSDNN